MIVHIVINVWLWQCESIPGSVWIHMIQLKLWVVCMGIKTVKSKKITRHHDE